MIVLTSTDKIQIKLNANVASSQLPCYASYRDTTTTSITVSRSYVNSNNTSTVDLIGSPAASTQRIVDYINIYNADTSSSVVTIQANLNNTIYVLNKVTLLPNERLEYQEGIGFKSTDTNGAVKRGNELGSNTITSGYSSTSISATVVNNNAIANTMQDITGLSFSVTSGKTYWFRFVIPYTTALTTTGCRFSINGPTASALYYESYWPTSTGALNSYSGISAYDTPAASNASTGLNSVAVVEGVATFSNTGTLIGRFASEVSGSAITVQPGAVVYYKQLD